MDTQLEELASLVVLCTQRIEELYERQRRNADRIDELELLLRETRYELHQAIDVIYKSR